MTRRERARAALVRAGADADVALLDQIADRLRDGPTLAVIGRDGAAIAHVVRAVATHRPEWRVVAHVDDGRSHDRWLAAHALWWVTSPPAVLGQEERERLDVIDASGGPALRWIVIAELERVARMSDDPEREIAEICDRAARVGPPGWPVATPAAAMAAVDGALFADEGWGQLERATAARLDHLGAYFAEAASARATQQAQAQDAHVAALEAALTADEARVAEIRAAAARLAGRALAAVRRATDTTATTLRARIHRLADSLADEVDALPPEADVARLLPAWLDHVLAGLLTDQAATWRAAVAADLADAEGLDEVALDLAIPMLAVGVRPAEDGWQRGLGLTAALGAGLLLALSGLWVPAAALAGVGAALSAWPKDKDKARTAVVDAARRALVDLGDETERSLRDQIGEVEARLAGLADDRAATASAANASARDALIERRAVHRARAAEAKEMAHHLAAIGA